MSGKEQKTEGTKYDSTELSGVLNLPPAALNMILGELPPDYALEVSAHIQSPAVPDDHKWSAEAKGIAQRIGDNLSIVYNVPADGSAVLPQALNQLHQVRSITNEIQSLDRPLLDRIQFCCSFLIHFGEEPDDYPTMQRSTVKFAVFCAIISVIGLEGGLKKGDDVAIGIGGGFGVLCLVVVALMVYRKCRHDRAQRLTTARTDILNPPARDAQVQGAPGYGSTFHHQEATHTSTRVTSETEMTTLSANSDANMRTPLLSQPVREDENEEEASSSQESFQPD